MSATLPDAPNSKPSAAASPRAARKKGCLGRGIAFLLLLGLVGSAAWTWFSLTWNYSEGERAGVLQKFSRKGWVCKTYEGELAQYVLGGVSPQIWYFSVRDPKFAQELFRHVGERLQVHYTEHRGVPTNCFAETSYFADSYRIVAQ
ncbi:MAG: hypothetical protein WCE48_03425 [Steroidobacteraceae bacterium]